MRMTFPELLYAWEHDLPIAMLGGRHEGRVIMQIHTPFDHVTLDVTMGLPEDLSITTALLLVSYPLSLTSGEVRQYGRPLTIGAMEEFKADVRAARDRHVSAGESRTLFARCVREAAHRLMASAEGVFAPA